MYTLTCVDNTHRWLEHACSKGQIMWKQWHDITWLGAKGHDWTEHSMKWHPGMASRHCITQRKIYAHNISKQAMYSSHLRVIIWSCNWYEAKEIICCPQPSLWVHLWWCRALASVSDSPGWQLRLRCCRSEYPDLDSSAWFSSPKPLSWRLRKWSVKVS